MSDDHITLHLTSPPMGTHGKPKAVRDAAVHTQRLLQKSDYGTFYAGLADGVYGHMTAAGAHRAKYALGYPKRRINESAGPGLRAYLSGEKGLSLAMRARRKGRNTIERLRQRRRQVALQAAITMLGTKESPPDSNIVLFSKWYGFTGSWCAMFVSWCYSRAGSRHFRAGAFYAYCPYILADAIARRNGLSVVGHPEPGDLVLYDWPGESKGVPDHVGLFEKWEPKAGAGGFMAIEGNTSYGNDSNGGEVMRRSRTTNLVRAFVRVS